MEHDDPKMETLRQLLAWKRHEAPPPGFFRDFPDRVLSGVRRDQAQRAVPWWEALWAMLRREPVLAGACALAVGGFYLVGAGLRTPAPVAVQSGWVDFPSQPAKPQHGSVHTAPRLVAAPYETAENGNPSSPSLRPVVSAPPIGLFTPGAGLSVTPARAPARSNDVRFSTPGTPAPKSE